MLRKAVTLALAFCLAAWIVLGIDLPIALARGGMSGVAAAVLHVAGETSQFGVASWRAAVGRLAALLLITVGFSFLRHLFSRNETSTQLQPNESIREKGQGEGGSPAPLR
jgi:putative Mn2+ efflux pump MntP